MKGARGGDERDDSQGDVLSEGTRSNLSSNQVAGKK